MNLSAMTQLRAREEDVEMEGNFIEKVGTQYCVRSHNTADDNFGCYPSKEEAEAKLRTIMGEKLEASQFGDSGWQYGRRMPVGYIPKRTLSGFPKTGGTGFRRPNPSLRAEYGEPMTGNMAHSHIDPAVWFHPPSLTKRYKNEDLRVPTDNPRETNDKFLDVTKRNSKGTNEQRMKILKRSSPGPQVPVKTTGVEQHSGTYNPSALFASHRRARALRGRIFVSYDRQGIL